MKIRAVGIPWFRENTFRTARALFLDGAEWPDAYEQWLQSAVELERRIKATGQMAVRAYIEPAAFPLWAAQRGIPLDARARSAFADQAARDAYVCSMDPKPVSVTLPNGDTEIGIQIAPTILELSAAALSLEPRDELQIDDRHVFIAAVDQQGGVGPDGSVEITVRVSFAG